MQGWCAKAVQGWASLRTGVVVRGAMPKGWTQENSHCGPHFCISQCPTEGTVAEINKAVRRCF